MKGNPSSVIRQHQSRCDHELCKIVRVDAIAVVFIEVETRLLEELDRVGRIHVLTEHKTYIRIDSDLVVEGVTRTDLRLKWKLNCQVEMSSGTSPASLESVRPIWTILSRSTLHRIVW